MSLTTEQREQTVKQAVREISHIATLPEITLKIIDLVEDPSSTAQDLHDVISGDPALCTRILKVVNSSFYGLPGQVASINRAIVMLGLNAVKNIAIAASLAKLFRGGDLTPTFSARDLWKHANATAAACKMVSDAVKLGMGDEAYLGGLVHDIGIMVEMQYDRDRLIQVIDNVETDDSGVPQVSMLEIEDNVFGANHQDFGHELCTRWKFPRPFAAANAFHHNPLEAPEEFRRLVCLIAAGDRLAAEQNFGFRLDMQETGIDESVREVLGLTEAALGSVRERLPDVLASIDTSLT